jgi:hypothetical protein
MIVLVAGLAFWGCSKQTGLDQIMQNPQMKTYLMGKMMDDQSVKMEMIDKLLADSAWVSAFVDRLSKQMVIRDAAIAKLIGIEGVKENLLNKMAEDPALLAQMKELAKK